MQEVRGIWARRAATHEGKAAASQSEEEEQWLEGVTNSSPVLTLRKIWSCLILRIGFQLSSLNVERGAR